MTSFSDRMKRLGSQMVSRFSSKVNSDSVGSGDPQMHRMPENINSSGLSRSRCSSTGGGDESSVRSVPFSVFLP